MTYGVRGSSRTREVASVGRRYVFGNYVSPRLHAATLYDLAANATYEYRVDGSFPYAFAAPPPEGAAARVRRRRTGLRGAPRGGRDRRRYPATFAVVGDLGGRTASARTVAAVASEDVAAFLVVGDLSYANGDGPVWDDWANVVEPVARGAETEIAGSDRTDEPRNSSRSLETRSFHLNP